MCVESDVVSGTTSSYLINHCAEICDNVTNTDHRQKNEYPPQKDNVLKGEREMNIRHFVSNSTLACNIRFDNT